MIRKRRNQKEVPIPKTVMGKITKLIRIGYDLNVMRQSAF